MLRFKQVGSVSSTSRRRLPLEVVWVWLAIVAAKDVAI